MVYSNLLSSFSIPSFSEHMAAHPVLLSPLLSQHWVPNCNNIHHVLPFIYFHIFKPVYAFESLCIKDQI